MGNCRARLLGSLGKREIPIWQVEVEPASDWHEGMWLDYVGPWNRILEAAYQYTWTRPWMCHIVELEDHESGWIEFEVDLRTYIQTSNRSGMRRRVRRVLARPP